MRERQRRQRAVDARHVGGLVGGAAGEVEVGVRQHHALGPPGGAARVQQRRQVVIIAGDDRPRLGRFQL